MATDNTQPGQDAAIVFEPKQSRSAPVASVGVIGWLRENLFYSWFSTIVTVVVAWGMFEGAAYLYDWGVTKAVFEAESRRQCLNTSPDGACWAGIIDWMNGFMYGRYPDEEQWRINLGGVLLIAWVLPFWLPNLKGKIGIGMSAVMVYPFLAAYLFLGGERGVFLNLMVFLAITLLVLNWVHVVLFYLTGRTLTENLVRMTGFEHRPETTHKYPMLALVAVVWGCVYAWLGDWQLELVRTNLWGGLFLTIVIAGVAIVSALPGGVALALARRSTMPVIRVFAITFIELFRSVPLITVLFMAVTMMPLFLPEDFQLNKLVQVMIGVCLFAAAYMAEVVRGGLQAIPNGQYEAAKAMGLSYWKMMNLVILPQALKLMIPNIVGNFMGLLKDTTLVSIIGLYDMLNMLKAVGQNPIWIGLHKEPLVFGAAIYFVLCFAMSKYSQRLERTIGQGNTGR
ncbi:MAG: amino acid ABC transporter permease [Ectothiorhodospiraceae bacterium]|nr:amino acid ABC transporter permease [Ectothiorhodospiraceae bacterium]